MKVVRVRGPGAGGGAGEVAGVELERVDVGIAVVGLTRHVDAVERSGGLGHRSRHLGLEIDSAADALGAARPRPVSPARRLGALDLLPRRARVRRREAPLLPGEEAIHVRAPAVEGTRIRTGGGLPALLRNRGRIGRRGDGGVRQKESDKEVTEGRAHGSPFQNFHNGRGNWNSFWVNVSTISPFVRVQRHTDARFAASGGVLKGRRIRFTDLWTSREGARPGMPLCCGQ